MVTTTRPAVAGGEPAAAFIGGGGIVFRRTFLSAGVRPFGRCPPSPGDIMRQDDEQQIAYEYFNGRVA